MAQKTYTVQSGDSLSLISQIFYGDFSMTDAIGKANNISNMNVIYPGQVLVLPEVANAPEASQTKSGSKAGKYILFSALAAAGVFFGVRAWKKYKAKA